MPGTRITHIDAIFGQIIALQRKQRGMDQTDLAKLLGVKQPALSRLERGESSANIDMLVKLAEEFHISAAELMQEFENAKAAVEFGDVEIVPKKDASEGVALALLGAAALAFLISR